MRETEIRMMARAAAVTASALVFLIFRMAEQGGSSRQRVLRAYHEIAGFLQKKSRGSSGWQRWMQWLTRNGAPFYYGKKVEPLGFAACCLLLGMIGFSAGIAAGIGGGLAALLLTASAPMWVLLCLNRRDNERMLPELKLVYHALEIQIRAGVYVTDALAEVYGSVREKRLRQALLELAGDIVMKADIRASLERFQGKFDNRYVDSLCITILQALESGQAVELLRDMGEQIRDMEAAVMERKKAALDRKITFCQLGVVTVVLGAALFLCVRYMLGSAVAF